MEGVRVRKIFGVITEAKKKKITKAELRVVLQLKEKLNYDRR